MTDDQQGHAPACVYFDGACPLCRAEIAFYRRRDHRGGLAFVDVSKTDACLPDGLSRDQAMARFHVRRGDGVIVSGAAAFVAVWRCLPGWRWVARIAMVPGALRALEGGYRLFLRLRPRLSRFPAPAASGCDDAACGSGGGFPR